MASTLTNYSENIDTTFPVPGQDNDTQGFRDNFIAIKNSLDTAAAEISDVQIIQTSLVTHALSQPASSVGKPGDLNGQIYATSSTVYICYADYVNTTTNIWAKVATVSGSW
jgi:hypothetical protein